MRAAEKEAKIWQANAEAAAVIEGEAYQAPLQFVGDIIVGGHSIVPEGQRIEKSAIVGGGKETYIDTVASSDGKILGSTDLDKLGLGDKKAIEKLKKELEKIAGGQEWKLDVIDTPHGREYRGIIGEDGQPPDGGQKSEKKAVKKGSKKDVEQGEEGEEGSQEEFYHEEL